MRWFDSEYGRKRLRVIALVLLLDALIWGVIILWPPSTLNRLAYNVDRFHGYTVYLKEGENYVPYLVVTNNYNRDGNVLLLRKNTLDEPQPFNEGGTGSEYYENSTMDQYVNEEFLPILASEVQSKILETHVKIHAPGAWTSYYWGGSSTTYIRRKAFILSYVELGMQTTKGWPMDGQPLRYFKDDIEHIRTTNSSGTPDDWMLRSAHWDGSCMSISYETGITRTSILEAKGVRPAFCMSRDTKIKKDDNIIKGKKVYVLAEE